MFICKYIPFFEKNDTRIIFETLLYDPNNFRLSIIDYAQLKTYRNFFGKKKQRYQNIGMYIVEDDIKCKIVYEVQVLPKMIYITQ